MPQQRPEDEVGGLLEKVKELLTRGEKASGRIAFLPDEQQKNALIESLPAAFFVADSHSGTVVEANSAFLILTGLTREEALGNQLSKLGVEIIPDSDEDHWYAPGEPRRVTIIDRPGARIPAIMYQNRKEMAGENYLLTLLMDVTLFSGGKAAGGKEERRETSASDRFGQDPRGVATLLMELDETDSGERMAILRRASPLARDLLGLDESSEGSVIDFLPGIPREELIRTADDVLGAGRSSAFDSPYHGTIVVRPEGEGTVSAEFWPSSRGAIREHDRSVTESMGLLAGSIAHDINEILLALQNIASTAAGTEEERRAEVDVLVRRVRSLTDLLLEISPRSVKTLDFLNLGDLVRTVVARSRLSLESNVAVSFTPTRKRLMTKGDPDQLAAMLRAVIQNAIEAAEPAGFVGISLSDELVETENWSPAISDEGDYAYILVHDSGDGMSDDEITWAIRPYTTSRTGQLGLGLSMASAISVLHSGRIHFRRTPDGFEVMIALPLRDKKDERAEVATEPRREAAAAVGEPAGQSPDDQADQTGTELEEAEVAAPGEPGEDRADRKPLVLLVDDEVLAREAASGMLRMLGFEVLEAGGGEEGIRVFRERGDEISFSILDIVMPGMDGLSLLDSIMELRPNAMVLMSTGYAADSRLQKALDRGAKGVVRKPYGINELAIQVAAVYPP